MKNLSDYYYVELNQIDLAGINGGGPIKEAVKWYYLTVGSFYRGIYDGLLGNEPIT
ncbi:hypothetical protein [Lutimonas sp.]|uniref:hypothetical protein n=1 Tax=Lutimonas sp. TaxID=1872403 RepID=UPI003D9B3147